jgi:hypothetical protein
VFLATVEVVVYSASKHKYFFGARGDKAREEGKVHRVHERNEGDGTGGLLCIGAEVGWFAHEKGGENRVVGHAALGYSVVRVYPMQLAAIRPAFCSMQMYWR